MTDYDFRPPVSGETSNVDALERFVIDTARDDVPPQDAKARFLASAALTLPVSGGLPSQASIVRALAGRGAYAIGLALLGSGAVVGFMRGTQDPPATSPSNGPAITAVVAPVEPSIPSLPAPLPLPESTTTTVSNLAPTGAAAERKPVGRTSVSEHATEATAAKTSPPLVAGEPLSTLDREIAHMSTVRTALARGDATRALELLDAYDIAFPSGAFRIDVSVLRIEALARTGRTTEARKLGEAFLAQYPESASARRVTLTLRSIASPSHDSALSPPPE